jgi:hypothetical protein
MARRTPFRNISAVVTPSMYEEIERLAAANKITKSQMVRQLLEERLTQKANERTEDAFSQVARRLQRIEERFSALMVKGIRTSAQSTYINMKQLEYLEENGKEVTKIWEASREFAGQLLEQKSKKKG